MIKSSSTGGGSLGGGHEFQNSKLKSHQHHSHHPYHSTNHHPHHPNKNDHPSNLKDNLIKDNSSSKDSNKKSTTTNDDPNSSSTPSSSSLIVAHFYTDSIKMIGESKGVSILTDDAARITADNVTMLLKYLLQDSQKYTRHGKRSMLTWNDINYCMKNKNITPMFGYCDKQLLPFRFASSGGREIFWPDEKEIELLDAIQLSSMAKLPQDVSIKCHWLSIGGVQPAIPENPPPFTKDRLRLDSIDPSQKIKLQQLQQSNPNKFILENKKKLVETIKIKQLATHELSMEQQLYYKEITEACVGSDESRRSEALQSLTYDSGIHQMLPRLCTFISEGVKVNVVQNNLALLIYLMRMVKALLDNHNLYLEKYLHELIPTVLTCIVSKQLCLRPEQDNHWALRDFGSRLLAQICRNFNTNTNNIQIRVTQLLNQSLDKERIPLSSLYGTIACLCEMGPEVQRAFLLKRLRFIGERIRINLEGLNVTTSDKTAAGHIESLILRVLPPTIKNLRSPPDLCEDYRNEYGYLGPQLHLAVVNLRAKENISYPGQHRISIPSQSNQSSSGGSGAGGGTSGTSSSSPSTTATTNIPYRRISNPTATPTKFSIIASTNIGGSIGGGTNQISGSIIHHQQQLNTTTGGNITFRMLPSSSSSTSSNNINQSSLIRTNIQQQQHHQILNSSTSSAAPSSYLHQQQPHQSSTTSSATSSSSSSTTSSYTHPN